MIMILTPSHNRMPACPPLGVRFHKFNGTVVICDRMAMLAQSLAQLCHGVGSGRRLFGLDLEWEWNGPSACLFLPPRPPPPPNAHSRVLTAPAAHAQLRNQPRCFVSTSNQTQLSALPPPWADETTLVSPCIAMPWSMAGLPILNDRTTAIGLCSGKVVLIIHVPALVAQNKVFPAALRAFLENDNHLYVGFHLGSDLGKLALDEVSIKPAGVLDMAAIAAENNYWPAGTPRKNLAALTMTMLGGCAPSNLEPRTSPDL